MAEKIVKIAESVTVGELADTLGLPVTTLIGELFKNGIVATINQRLDFETATIIVEELKLDVSLEKKELEVHEKKAHKVSDNAKERPPIVAVMGHVDHGKTSLLDAILEKKTVDDEAGGITQHISAYQAKRGDRVMTLLDTPGHEAFAALRQHGATLTDVVVIVVAADDGVMPQTVEAIRFAQTANAKVVVAINKMDKETANPGLVKGQLAEHGIIADDKNWGGDVPMVEVSAKTSQGIGTLLDTVFLVADMEELKADVDIPAEGLVIEAHMEVGRGAVVGLLVEHGSLRPGHYLVAGTAYGRVRTLQDFRGDAMKEAGPSTPVNVTGFKELPQFGDSFIIAKTEKEARNMAAQSRLEQEQLAASTNVTGADILKMMNQQHDAEEFNVVVKADVQGSLTSVVDSLKLIETNGEVNLHVIGTGVGNISERDIQLATGKNTVVYGFNVDLPASVKRLATRDRVEVRRFSVIYELLDDAKKSMEDLLAPEIVETEVGKLKIKGVFRTMRDEIIAGGEVMSGKVQAGLLARVIRKKEQIAEVEISSVQREQAEAKEVFEGELCGLKIKTTKKLNLEEGDRLEFFSRKLVKKTL